MSERDDRYVRDDLPRTTGEFRATPDSSASTAEFKAFAAGQDGRSRQGGASSWPEQPWAGDGAADRRGSGRMALLILGVVVVIAVLVAVFFIR